MSQHSLSAAFLAWLEGLRGSTDESGRFRVGHAADGGLVLVPRLDAGISAENLLDRGVIGVRLTDESEVHPIPRVLTSANRNDASVVDLWTWNSSGAATLRVDVLGVFDWASGWLNAGALSNWSKYIASQDLQGLAFSDFVGAVLAETGRVVGLPAERTREFSIVVTGDTDEANEQEICSYLERIHDVGGSATLLFRKSGQMSRRVARMVISSDEVGIHPYATNNSLCEYLDSAKHLAASVFRAFDRPARAWRSHRFQCFSASEVRRAMVGLGMRTCLDLVAADGRAWLGLPTGLCLSGAYVGGGGDLLVVPTIVEDDVFLYDCDYSFKKSESQGAKFQGLYLERFFEAWRSKMSGPMVVNLHPEHLANGYTGVFDTVLSWAVKSGVPLESTRSLWGDAE